MADKSFGVKELNLFGSSGTPTIDSPNDLNLNASTVAISTNLTVGNKLSISAAGIVTAISGTITYYGDGSHLTGISAATGAVKCISTKNYVTEGTCSGCNFSGAEHNIILGECAGKITSSGDRNVFLGMCAGHYNASSSDSIYIGTCAGRQATGCKNVFLGNQAGDSVTSGCCNIVIGNDVDVASATGNTQFIIGSAGNKWICGDSSYNIFDKDGNQLNGASGGFAPDARQNLISGYNAGKCLDGTYASNNILLGCDTGCCVTSGCYNIGFGWRSLQGNSSAVTGSCNIAMGRDAGRCISSSANNVFLGTEAGRGNGSLTGSNNVAFGTYALQQLTSGTYNFSALSYAGCEISSGYSNITIGEYAGSAITSGHNNVYLGSMAGRCNANDRNIFIGQCAGREALDTNNGTYIGYAAGRCMCCGNNNIAIGNAALRGSSTVSSNTGNTNTVLGHNAGYYVSSGSCNAFLGCGAGMYTTTGNFNTFAGNCAGCCNTSGCHNVVIGTGVVRGGPSASASDTGNCQFAIGAGTNRWITGDSNFNIYDKDGNQINGGGGGGGGTPGGSNTQVQYNSSGSFAGSSNLTFDGTHLTVGGCVNASTSVASSANGLRKITSSTSSPSGGSDGDIWIKYTA